MKQQDLISEMSNLQVTDNPGNGQQQQQQFDDVSRELPHKMGLSHPTNNTTMMKDTLNSVRSSSPPANLIKPPVPLFDQSSIRTDMKHIQALYETYTQKSYHTGYVHKKQDLAADEQQPSEWTRCYAELCGPRLTLWEEQQQQQPSDCIDITDAEVQIINEPGRENVFSIYTPEDGNIYLFDVPDAAVTTWICAIRLSCFEYSKIHELFTHKFVSRYSDALAAKPLKKMEGYVQAWFEGGTDWKKYWAVVSDTRKEEKKLLFGKRKSVKAEGRILFYETKKSKSPVYTMEKVTRTYILYPKDPQAIDAVSTLKAEGNMVDGERTSVLIMAPSTKDLVKWAIGCFDAFKLYGRPATLHNNVNNIQSLNFGDHNTPQRLFLNLSDVVNSVDVQQADNINLQFTNVLVNKMKQPPPNKLRQNSMNQQRQRKPVYSNTSAQSSLSQISQHTNRYSPPKHHVYDSDEDSEEEEEEEVTDSDDDDDDDSDDSFILSSLRRPKGNQTSSSTSSDMDKKSTSTRDSTVSSSLQRTAASSHSSLSLYSQSTKPKSQLNKPFPADEYDDYFSGSNSEDAASFSQQPQWDEYAIPPLGNHFATQNSLLDTYRPSGPSAQDQQEYARATGQPFIQVAQKPGVPRAGLVGMISQIEKEKRKENTRNRYSPQMMHQQQQQQPMMMYPGMMPMMQPMMYPGMMQPQMMHPQMMPNMMMMPMMDPRMMMMSSPYPMHTSSSSSSRVNLVIPEDEDEDDDVPLGHRDSFHTQKIHS